MFKLDTADNETVLYGFTGGADGAAPSGLVPDAQGTFDGTTEYGGLDNCVDNSTYVGCGTVFKVDVRGNETVLYSFTGTNGDGANPWAGLVLDSLGNLYGTTFNGGNLNWCFGFGCGTVFKVDTTGDETVLTSDFANNGIEGQGPDADLVLDAQGNLYGTTLAGGANGFGTVFKVDAAGNMTVLYSFTGTGVDGIYPYGLVLDAQGNLYGTTELGGGSPNCQSGCGTVFKLDTTGKETTLYSFTGSNGDGAHPDVGLVMDAQGNLYGTTGAGGNSYCRGGCGTVFKIDTTGKETVLYSFTGTNGDGANPWAGLVLNAQGNLYGTTEYGGAYGYGTVFKLIAGGFLNFPLANTDAYSADISSVFDHDVKADKKTKAPIFYGKNTTVRAYTAEEGVSNCGYPPCSEPVGTQGLVGYKNTNNQPFVITGHYTGGGGCNNGPCDLFLFYTGHSGFDYPQTFRTEIIAPADGLLFIPPDDPVIKPDKTPGQSVAKFDILAIDHGNGYASWFLHVGCEAGTKDQNGKVVCKKTQDFRGIDANGNVICSYNQLVTTGCQVKGGDVVGLVGNKGLLKKTSVSHLHFEVRKGLTENPNGLPACVIGTCIPVDPYGWTGTPGSDPYGQFLGGQDDVKLWK